MTTLTELQEGDTLVVTDAREQDCLNGGGKYTVFVHKYTHRDHDPYIKCAKGTHYLAANVGTDGHLIGWEKVK